MFGHLKRRSKTRRGRSSVEQCENNTLRHKWWEYRTDSDEGESIDESADENEGVAEGRD